MNVDYFPHILHCCGSSLPSLSVTLCLLPVSMKPLLLKSTLCSDWSAGAVCCDWSSASSVFGKCPALSHNRQFNTLLTNSTRPRPFILRINYLNEEYCDVFVPGRNSRLQWRRFREFRNTDTEKTFFMFKQ